VFQQAGDGENCVIFFFHTLQPASSAKLVGDSTQKPAMVRVMRKPEEIREAGADAKSGAAEEERVVSLQIDALRNANSTFEIDVLQSMNGDMEDANQARDHPLTQPPALPSFNDVAATKLSAHLYRSSAIQFCEICIVSEKSRDRGRRSYSKRETLLDLTS
jgi:hypothetical protein